MKNGVALQASHSKKPPQQTQSLRDQPKSQLLYRRYSTLVIAGMDKLINKLPGSPPVKAFLCAGLVTAALAYPVFRTKDKTQQGHDLFSQEKPEAIASGQERARREQRKNF